MTAVTDHPLVNGFAPAWATEWGDDEFGPWVAFQIGDARQMLRWIPAGEFLMGSPEPDRERSWTENECPPHWVAIGHGFWMFDTPVTQQLWQAVMGGNPSRFEDSPHHPVEQVSWTDCRQFVAKVNEQIHGLNLRLPTEAEWEYACRAGSDADRYGLLDAIAWYDRNSQGSTRLVRQKQANAWGLFDMLGNVWEWCQDNAFRQYTEAMAFDPFQATDDEDASRVTRGGSWSYSAPFVRAAFRNCRHPGTRIDDLGFRCLSSPEPSPAKVAERR